MGEVARVTELARLDLDHTATSGNGSIQSQELDADCRFRLELWEMEVIMDTIISLLLAHYFYFKMRS